MENAVIALLEKTPFNKIAPMVWYPGYIRGMPDLMVFIMPPALRPRNHDAFRDQYRVVFIENDQDRRDAEQAITRPVTINYNERKITFPMDDINRRSSTVSIGDAMIYTMLYMQESADWPFLVVTSCSDDFHLGDEFSRGRYAWEAFPTEADAMEFCAEMGKRMQQCNPGVEFDFMSSADQKKDS